MIDKNYEIDIITTEADLLDSNNAEDLKLRIFNSVSGSSILGIVLTETEDSFLVALPSKLMAFHDKRAIEPLLPFMPVPFIRLFKFTNLSVIPCYGEFEIYYLEYILNSGILEYPNLLEVGYVKDLIKRDEDIKNQIKEIIKLKAQVAVVEPKASEVEDELLPIGNIPTSRLKH